MKHNNSAIINPENIHTFWENRAQRYHQKELVNVSNLEHNITQARKKHEIERKVLLSYIRPSPSHILLDLGAGHCAWSVELAKVVAHVDAVEYSSGMIKLAQENILREDIKNIVLHQKSAQDFNSDKKYDTILLSGLTIYLSDEELSMLLTKMQKYIQINGRVILRDGTGKKEPFIISNKFSNELDDYYSAYYRTESQYIEKFQQYGFEIVRSQNMFKEGSEFNKRKETILRIYEFSNRNPVT
jgi:cyclopropane fatty-acyl-phospholipid synthase-like methyltransferase